MNRLPVKKAKTPTHMYRSILSAIGCASMIAAVAQQYVHQVLVLNEGYYDVSTHTQVVPVSLGSYRPSDGTYQTVATIENARFGNHVAVDGDVAYVAADHRLLKYDASTFALLAEADVPGIRRFAVWNNELVITLGEVGGLPHYCEVRDKNTLELVHIVDNDVLPYSCEGVQVVGDKAYLAVNNAFDWSNTVGRIGVLDLAAQQWEASIDLGPDGTDPELIFADGDAVYAFNNKDFTGSSISKMSTGDNALQYTHNVAMSSGCGSSAKVENRIYFMEYAQNALNRYDLTSGSVLDTLSGSPATYGLIDDPIDHVLYGTTTDFFSSGELHVLDYTGHVLGTVPVGVSPGRLALDVRSATGVEEARGSSAIHLYPNPVTDEVFVRVAGSKAGQTAEIIDCAGRVLAANRIGGASPLRFDVSDLARGMYSVRVAGGATARFVKP